MRTKLWVAAVLLLVLALAGPAAAQSKSNAPLSCDVSIAVGSEFNPMGSDWFGFIAGDINGYIGFTEQQGGMLNTVRGKTEHFLEDWTIWVNGDPDVTISGVNEGVWNFSTFKFRANGWVTGASSDWKFLVGHKFHEIGTTTDPNTTWPILGDAEMFIAGP